MKIYNIVKIKNNITEISEDYITEEITLAIDVNNKEIVQLLCSPDNLKDLTIGYLFTSGIINTINDVKKIDIIPILGEKILTNVELANPNKIDNLNFKSIQPTGCGKGNIIINESVILNKIISDLKIKSSVILSLMNEFQNKSENYKKSGGVHSAAIVEDNRIIAFMDDIGRHNAIDKVIGKLIMDCVPLDNKIIFTSGRITSEILQKIRMCRIPVIVTKSAPTDQAIKICNENNITLLGFVRGNRMNIYSNKERIIV